MKEIQTIELMTHLSDYSQEYKGDYFEYYQIHIFDISKVVSKYFNPENYSIDQVRAIANDMLTKIRARSSRKNRITLFEKNGKFLICESNEVIDAGEVLEYDAQKLRYDIFENDLSELEDFIGETNMELYIKKALISVGAEDLYPVIEHQAKDLRQTQLRISAYFDKWRELNKSNPLYKLEIYKIEKNYVPLKIKEFLCSPEYGLDLPEHKSILKTDRTAYILREIATDKKIEGNINDVIEKTKLEKSLRKNPHLIDPEASRRMELDNDDPDFLSCDEYTKNDDEYEDGDDEYSPQ